MTVGRPLVRHRLQGNSLGQDLRMIEECCRLPGAFLGMNLGVKSIFVMDLHDSMQYGITFTLRILPRGLTYGTGLSQGDQCIHPRL